MGTRARLNSLRKNPNWGHSERSEESGVDTKCLSSRDFLGHSLILPVLIESGFRLFPRPVQPRPSVTSLDLIKYRLNRLRKNPNPVIPRPPRAGEGSRANPQCLSSRDFLRRPSGAAIPSESGAGTASRSVPFSLSPNGSRTTRPPASGPPLRSGAKQRIVCCITISAVRSGSLVRGLPLGLGYSDPRKR